MNVRKDWSVQTGVQVKLVKSNGKLIHAFTCYSEQDPNLKIRVDFFLNFSSNFRLDFMLTRAGWIHCWLIRIKIVSKKPMTPVWINISGHLAASYASSTLSHYQQPNFIRGSDTATTYVDLKLPDLTASDWLRPSPPPPPLPPMKSSQAIQVAPQPSRSNSVGGFLKTFHSSGQHSSNVNLASQIATTEIAHKRITSSYDWQGHTIPLHKCTIFE